MLSAQHKFRFAGKWNKFNESVNIGASKILVLFLFTQYSRFNEKNARNTAEFFALSGKVY